MRIVGVIYVSALLGVIVILGCQDIDVESARQIQNGATDAMIKEAGHRVIIAKFTSMSAMFTLIAFWGCMVMQSIRIQTARRMDKIMFNEEKN